MNTKTCKKCGWVYPINWPGRKCRFCQEQFDEFPCPRCGKIVNKLYSGICIECSGKHHEEWRQQKINNAETCFSNWLAMIAKQPTKTLTEEQWMKACKHFGGCAYCGNDSIDARSLFVRFKEGGRYCAWNVIPSCERCETLRKSIHNPFLRMNSTFYRDRKDPAKKYGFSLIRLNKILEYLQSNMEDVQDESV